MCSVFASLVYASFLFLEGLHLVKVPGSAWASRGRSRCLITGAWVHGVNPLLTAPFPSRLQGDVDGLKAAVHQQALQKRNSGSSSVLAGGSLDPVSDKERCCTVREQVRSTKRVGGWVQAWHFFFPPCRTLLCGVP